MPALLLFRTLLFSTLFLFQQPHTINLQSGAMKFKYSMISVPVDSINGMHIETKLFNTLNKFQFFFFSCFGTTFTA
jgi:hypothetical protein